MTATPAHRRLAGEIARKSLVLLRNDGTLPLRPNMASVAVIGPNADEPRHLVGDYSYAVHVESLKELLRSGRNVFAIPLDDENYLDAVTVSAPSVREVLSARLGERVRFARGCDVNSASRDGFADAVAVAAGCDVAVMVMGDKAGLTDDCTTGESRDVASLDLPGVQEELVHAVLDTGTPVVLVLVAGRPLASAALQERCAAVLMAWLPGRRGRRGDRRRRSPVTSTRAASCRSRIHARSARSRRTTATRSRAGGRTGRATTSTRRLTPLYPFGHGLSYTTFGLSDAVVGAPRGDLERRRSRRR